MVGGSSPSGRAETRVFDRVRGCLVFPIMLFLWTGPRHSGKTTQAARLARRAGQYGFRVAGLLAPAVYREGHLVGFDALDLQSEARSPLAVRRADPGDIGPFHFVEEGLRLGHQALDAAATEGADLVIVDEFGPLELASRGWRQAVNALVEAGRTPLLLIVRRELAGAVREAYAGIPSRILDASAPESAREVIRFLADGRTAQGAE
jgi:nucleoside-triphosphatase THEP1